MNKRKKKEEEKNILKKTLKSLNIYKRFGTI